MYMPLNFNRLNIARLNKRTRFIFLIVCVMSVAITTFAHAFLSVNSKYIQFSKSSDRKSSTALSSKIVSGNVYIFLAYKDPKIKSVAYFFNPTSSLTDRNAFVVRTRAPYDLGGTTEIGTARPFDAGSLQNGTNVLVTKITLNSGYVHHDYTWFQVGNSISQPTPTQPPATQPVTKPTIPATNPTNSTTPATMPPDHGGGSMNENCTPGTIGMHGPCIYKSAIPASRSGFSTQRITPYGQVTTLNGEPGAFRTRCDFSHMNNDDPVLFLNQPGKAHLHTFFGNTGANAFSTSSSLMNSGNSTCSGGILNRSSYWVPAMVDSRNGRPITPNDDRSQWNSDLEIYYKLGYQGVANTQVRSFPEGLQMIAGNTATASGPTSGTQVDYWCEGAVGTDRTQNLKGPSIPRCTQGQVLVMHINFPQCWDGANLRSANGRSHMAYGTWGVGCPASHPVGLPSMAMFVRYRVQSGDSSSWRLASDSYSNGPGGYSGHADYVFAWPNKRFDTVVNRCYRPLLDCGYQLGDGTGLTDPRF